MSIQIVTTKIITPLGALLAGTTENGICLLEFTDKERAEMQLAKVQRLFKATVIAGTHKHLKILQRQITEYFNGERKEFNVPLDIAGTEFQIKVWNALLTIPYGSTRSYSDQAQAINNQNAVRAVAKANGDNLISIIIPCHRVIGKNGKLVGYGGGLWRKQSLLELELKN